MPEWFAVYIIAGPNPVAMFRSRQEAEEWARDCYPYSCMVCRVELGASVAGVHHEGEPDHDRPPGSQRP